MRKIENMITESKLYEALKKRDKEKVKKVVTCVLVVLGCIAAIAGIAYAVHRFFTPNYLKDTADDDTLDDDSEEDLFEDEEL